MHRKLTSALIVAAVTLVPAAAWAAHGKPGLWTISTTMQMANMPQMPPEALAMMKARGMKMPGMGEPIVSQICMTPDQVNSDKLPAMSNEHGETCTSKVLSQTLTSVTAEATCHGHLDGVGHFQINWRGNEHYEGTYNFKGSVEGRPQEMTSHYTGDFVKADCGNVKPHMPAMAH